MYKTLKQTALLVFLSIIMATSALACVGRTLYIGALETTEDKVMAEMLATLINERTGTTIQIRYFKDTDSLYAALKSNVEEERADILVEDTVDAMAVIKGKAGQSADENYSAAKEAYEKDLGIIWLNPFGFNNSKDQTIQSISAPLVRRDVLTNFPLLPRILNKLSGVFTNQLYSDLIAKVDGGEKPKNAAKDFLKKKKLI